MSENTPAAMDPRVEIARLRAIIDGAVEELCHLAEEVEDHNGELADRLWTLANERLETPVKL